MIGIPFYHLSNLHTTIATKHLQKPLLFNWSMDTTHHLYQIQHLSIVILQQRITFLSWMNVGKLHILTSIELNSYKLKKQTSIGKQNVLKWVHKFCYLLRIYGLLTGRFHPSSNINLQVHLPSHQNSMTLYTNQLCLKIRRYTIGSMFLF